MNVLNLRTGEPFDPLPRLHHREESALQVSSSVNSQRARGMLLAAKSFYVGVAKKYTARDYVQDGLVAMWDGIENAGFGVHDASATTWKDLVGNHSLVVYGEGRFTDDSFSFVNTSAQCDIMSVFYTIDVCLKFEWSQDKVVVLNYDFDNFRRGLYYNQVDSEGKGFYFDGNGCSSRIIKTTNYIDRMTVSAVWDSPLYGSVSSNQYINGKINANASTHSSSWGPGVGKFVVGGSYIGGTSYKYGGKGQICCIRLYDRALAHAEIASNYAVDKARFGLP